MTRAAVGVIGLGLLGSALAERLLRAGYETVVYNRTRDKAAPLLDQGARWSDNPLADCPRSVICLYTTGVVHEVLQHLRPGLTKGHILIDSTTGDPGEIEALGRTLAETGVAYLEAPIAASSDQTRRGDALAIVAGPLESYRACEDIFRAIARKTLYLGETWGLAARMKLVNNLVLGLNRVALAEGLALAQAMELSPAAALDVLKQGSAYSTVMDIKGQKMVEREFSPQAKLSQHLKDVRLILREAQAGAMKLPLSQLHRQLLERAEQAGWGDLDNSAVIRLYDPRPDDAPS